MFACAPELGTSAQKPSRKEAVALGVGAPVTNESCVMPGCPEPVYAFCYGGRAREGKIAARGYCFTHIDDHITSGPHYHVGNLAMPMKPGGVVTGA